MLSGAMGSITHMTLVQVLVFSAFIVAVDPVVVSCRFPFPLVLYSLHRLLFSFSNVSEALCIHVCVCVCVCVRVCEFVCVSLCVSLVYMSDTCLEHVCLCRCVCQSMSVCMCDCVMCVCLFTSVFEHV